MTLEAPIQARILLEASRLGLRVWRNNTGALRDKNDRLVKYGLCVGSSDIIGIAPGGRFIAIEVKAPGKLPTPEQVKFISAVNKAGGAAFVCDDEKKLKSLLDEAGIKVQ